MTRSHVDMFLRTRQLVATDSPFGRYERHRQHDHAHHRQKRENQGNAETNKDLGNFQEGGTAFNFFLHCTPIWQRGLFRRGPRLREGLTNIVTEHVGEEGLAEMDRDTTEENFA